MENLEGRETGKGTGNSVQSWDMGNSIPGGPRDEETRPVNKDGISLCCMEVGGGLWKGRDSMGNQVHVETSLREKQELGPVDLGKGERASEGGMADWGFQDEDGQRAAEIVQGGKEEGARKQDEGPGESNPQAENDLKRRKEQTLLEDDSEESEDDESYRTGPDRTEPENDESYRTGPDRTPSEEDVSYQTGPDRTQSEEDVSYQTGPDRTQSEEEVSYQTGPDRTEPENDESYRTGPDRTQSEEDVSYQTRPDRTEPENDESHRTGPNRTGPNRTGNKKKRKPEI